MKKKRWILGLAALGILGFSTQGLAAVEFFGSAKVKPTYYSNFDFNDDVKDKPTLNEGGWTSGEHMRAELRLGWKASGEKWRVKMIAEVDAIMNKNTADRSYYGGQNDQTNAGAEFGIERAEIGYTFNKYLDLSTGWDITALDIKSGGLLYGDDHPFLALGGALTESTKYQLLYLPIQNDEILAKAPPGFDGSDATVTNDWRVYTLKIDQTIDTGIGKVTFSPLAAFSDNRAKQATVTYYGLEILGQLGPIKPSFEIIKAQGDFDNGKDISSLAFFAGVEVPINKAFNPYVAYRYTQGDDDSTDNDVKGFVGITDIGRFTPLMGMDGNILGEHLASGASPYGASLYAFAPERAVGGDGYGGIGNGGSGNNPGQKLVAVGTKGDLGALVPKLSYKTQAFFIWYDETANLNPGQKVDNYAGTTFDLQALYAVDKNFAIDYIFSTFIPGDGLQDQVNANDNAYVHMLTLAWTY